MIKSSALDIQDPGMQGLHRYLYRRLKGAVSSILTSGILTGDLNYAWYFVRYYRNELYKRHLEESYINCVFCTNLVRTGCHRHCLKCGAGTYIRCSPSLPGILYNESTQKDAADYPQTPWYFKEACGQFKRLPLGKYLKNLHFAFCGAGVYDYEVLEGLENGLSAGTKPCHVCAAADYELYKRCSAKAGFDAEEPCNCIYAELKSFYMNKDAKTKVS
ncbi:MAG TPA: hypothetical protein VHT96_10705 [Clostridia bacterium]|nr:hypothetical protein [Clostridia bacterium]